MAYADYMALSPEEKKARIQAVTGGPKPTTQPKPKPVSTPTMGMSAQTTPKVTGSIPQSTPSYNTPSSSSSNSSSIPITMRRVVDGKEITFNVTGDRGREIWERQGATVVNSAPTYTTYTPPSNFGVDSQGKPLTEQQWLGSGGLLGLSGKNEVGAAKLSDGSYLDTTNLTPQQINAATLWDEVKAGKRSADSVAAILKGQGIDAYGNAVNPYYQGNSVYYASGYTPSESALVGAPLSASAASTKVSAPTGSIPSGTMNSAAPSGLSASQKSAQDYIVKSGQWGTLDNYVQNNINRYLNGEISYDRLAADAQRVGYAIPPLNTGNDTPSGGNNVTPSGGYIPQSGPSFQEIAAAEAARDLANKQRIAGQQITGITNAFNRSNEILQGNRTLEDASINRTLNPFNGRTGYAKGLVGRERTLADETAQGNFNTAVQGIQQGLADDQNTAAQLIRARAYQLEQDAANRAMNEAQLTGYYDGNRTIAGQQLDYNMSPDNPANQAQILTNQINQLKLQNLPQELKLGLESLEQEVKTGALTLQEAQFKLNELQDPNSITNQVNRLELEAAKLGNQELRKRIAQIGVKPAMSESEKRLKQIELEQAEIELANLKNGTSGSQTKNSYKEDPDFQEDYAAAVSDPGFASFFSNNAQAFINKYGIDGYNAIKSALPDE